MKKNSSLLSVIGSRIQEGLRLGSTSGDKQKTNKQTKPKFSIEELEQRVLYSADDPLNASINTFDAPNNAVVRVVKTPATVQSDAKNTSQRELVVIDERVDDIAALKADFQSQIDSGKAIDIVIVDRDEDAFAVISNKLQAIAQRGEQVSAIHLIAHGTDQQMQLGATDITKRSIAANETSIQEWATTLTEDADVLLYGCDFAKSDAGKELVRELAALSHADVAASNDVTGADKLGGDWQLEYSTGSIEASIILSANGQHQYQGKLGLSAQGTETIVNSLTATAQATNPTVNSVAIANDGSYVVVFTDTTASNGNDIIAQRYNANGTVQGGNVTVNTTVTGAQQNATVAIDANNGDFIVAWDGSGTGDSTGVFYRRFSANGTALDATEVRANFTTANSQSNAAIAMNTVSDFYLTWTDGAQDGNLSGVYARRFNSSGAVSASDVLINNTVTNVQGNASIATAPNKNIIIAWESEAQDGNLTGVYFRQFDANLNALSPTDTLVNTGVTTGIQARPSIDMNASGAFVIAWHSPTVDSNLTGVVFQRYDATGASIGSNTRANTFQTGAQDRANVALANDGTFIVSWVSNGQDAASTLGTYGQAFNANGTTDGTEFLINGTVAGAQSNVSLAYNGDKAVAVWSGSGVGDVNGVFMQRYVRPNVIVNSVNTTTSESGGTATFSVVLSTAPTANVIVSVTTGNPAEGIVSTGTLTFTTANWNVAQVVTVTGVNDSFIDGAINYSINIAAATSTDLRFNGIDAPDLLFTNTDDDTFNTVVVNTTSDLSDGDVTSIAALYANKGGDGVISLREAIQAANATTNGIGGADRIEFNISGIGVQTISPTSALPIITQSVTIDGFTQSGASIGNLQAGTAHNLMVRLNGSAAGSSANAGLYVQANNVAIRGLNISGWAGNTNSSAIRVDVSQNTLIEGNYLGTNATGLAALANANAGIYLFNSPNTTIRNNLISGNGKSGIMLLGAATTNTVITANLIGVNATNTAALGNSGDGVLITGNASSNRIGGILAIEANVIANNSTGVNVASGTGNSVIGNSLYRNSGLAIDLGADGVSPNDINDVDLGANDLLNFPTGITAERVGGDLVVNAQMVSGLANTSFRIEIYSNPASAIEASNQGEGQTFLGAITVTTDVLGNALINATLLGVTTSAPSGSKISLTATRSLGAGVFGSTSEFALNAIAGFKPSVQTPSTGPNLPEDTSLLLTGIATSDLDSDVASVQATVLSGKISVNLAGGATISAGATGTNTLTLSGTQAQINTALATLTYQGTNGFNGIDRLRLIATDLSNLVDTKDLFITVNAVNNAPTISAPNGTQVAITSIPKIFSSANSNAIQINDIDAGLSLIEVSLTSDAFSKVSLSSLTGLSFTIGDGTNDSSIVFRGTVANINAALDGLAFTASPGTLTDPHLAIAVNDLGNSGSGGALNANTQINFQAFGVEIIDTGARVTTESGGKHVIGIRLRNAPTADVSLAITAQPPLGPAPLEATVSAPSITFTSTNWNVIQYVTVTGIDDAVQDGDKTYVVNIGPATTLDTNYTGLSTTALTFVNSDDDPPLAGGAVSITNITSANTTEAGAIANFSVVLTSAPTANVTINLAISNQAEAALSSSTITFTTANWNIAQVVTVTGLDDTLVDGNASYIVMTSATSSTDVNYNNVIVQDIAFTNTDNDTFNSVTVTTTADIADGDTRSLAALYNNLGADGKISLREAILAANNTQNSALVDRINFNIPGAGPHIFSLSSALPTLTDGVFIDGTSEPNYIAGTSPVVVLDGSSAGINTNGISVSATAANTKVQGLLIRNFSKNGIITNASSGIFQDNQIEANLLSGIAISSTTAQSNSILGSVFTNNGGLAIDLGAIGVTSNDANDLDSGANALQNFPVLTAATTTGTGISISGNLSSSANTSYRIEYFKVAAPDATGYGEATQFLGFVNVTTNASGIASFSTSAIATVSSTDKITATATRIVGANTFENSEFSQNINVLPAGITVSQVSGLVTTEVGGTATFSIVLDAPPIADVTINLSLSDITEGSLSVTSVTFTSSNWMTPQTVTVTGLNDTLADGNIAYSVITSSAVSADSSYNGRAVTDVALTNTDDDTVNTIVVDTRFDIVDGDTSSISALMSNLGADGRISLREAILAANATTNAAGGNDVIQFNLGGFTNRVISLSTVLPTITEAVSIDGQSLSGFASGTRMIYLDGSSLGASSNGLTIASSNSQITGLWFNGFTGAGIAVTSGTGNFLNQNLFTANVGLAIDVGPTGVNANDNLDADTGANNLQNSPELLAVSAGTSTTTIIGQIKSAPNSSYRIQLFLSSTQHGTGNGQAGSFLTQIDIVTNAAGFAQYSFALPSVIGSSQFVSATATLSNSTFTQFFDTSEISKALQVTQGPVLYADANTSGYVENAAGVPVFSNAMIVAADTNIVNSVTVSIISGFQSSRDLLSWTTMAGIIGTYDSNSGVLTFIGTANIASYQTLLNSLRYSNSSDDPLAGPRIFKVDTTSGVNTSSTQFSLTVTAVNDPAQIVTNIALTVAEGSTNFISPTQLTANDVDGVNRNLIYQVATGPSSGLLQRTSAVGLAITSFTQGEIEDGLIQYVHSGNELSTDSFTFRVSDGLSVTPLQTFSFIVTPVNDAPVATSSQLGSIYIENGASIRPLQTLVLSDVDSPSLSSATIVLTNTEPFDLLSFSNQNNISGSFNGTTKILTLTGSSSVANYQAAIRSITYSSTSDLFAQTSKNILVRVSDGSLNSNILSEQITITNVNDTPQVSTNALATLAEGASITISNTQLRFTDPDNAASQLTYTVSTSPANGRLELNTAPGFSITTFTQTDIDNGRIIYVHSGSETTTDSFVFRVSDGAGGTSSSVTFNLSITPVDDLATIQISTTPLTYTENASNTPISIASAVVLSDPDTPTLTQVRVRISAGYSAGNDLLLVNGTLPTGITSSWNSGTGTLTLSGTSLLANYKTAIESLRYVNSSEFPDTNTRTITFSLTNSNGAQGATSRQLDVVSVNDAPIINIPAPSFTIQEDNTFTFSGVNRISINDVDAQALFIRVTLSVSNLNVGANLSLSQTTGLTITTGTGYNDEQMQFEGTLADINAAINSLVFDPGTDFSGTNSIQITIDDRGNTGTSGIAQIVSRSITMNITAVNDPPKISGALSAGVNGGASLVLTSAIIQATDVDSPTTSLIFTVLNPFQHGNLMLLNISGPPTAISSFSFAELQAGRVYYQHNNDSATLDSLNFVVTDGAANSAIATLDILISRNNTAPVLGPISNPGVQFTEQSAPVALISNIVVNDLDSPLLRGAKINFTVGGNSNSDRLIFTDMTFSSSNVIRGSVDLFGNLTLSGIATTSEYQVALRSILFENTSLAPDTITRAIEVTVQDATLSSNISTVRVDVVPVNNAPTIIVTTGARTLEDTAFNEVGAIYISDADIGSGLLSVTLTTSQGLMSINTNTGVILQIGSGTNNATMTFTGTTSQINNALDSLIFLATQDFTGIAAISIQVTDSGDANGLNRLVGSATLQILVDSVNDAPVLTDLRPAAIDYSEGSAPVYISRFVLTSDVDSTTLTGATVQISAGYIAAEDRLIVTDSRGLSVSWDSITGTISINGNGTLDTYQGILRSIQYQNISLSVTQGTRSISTTISDESLTSLVGSKDINVIAINDAPIVSVGTLASFTENSAAVNVFPDLTLTDIDSTSIRSATLRITGNYLPNSDLLSMVNASNILATWNTTTATLSLIGNASITEYEAALRQIRFSSSSNNLIDTTRSFVLDVTDSTGAVASTNLTNFIITPVNDAPIVNLASSINVGEDTSATFLSNLMGNLRLADVDANQQNLSLIVSVNRGFLSIDPNQPLNRSIGTNTSEITLVGTLAQLSSAVGNIVFTPELDFNGSLQLQVALEDIQGSRDTKFAQVQVIAANDAPTINLGSNDQLTATIGTSTAILSTVSVKDVDSPLLDGAVVRVTSNFSSGDRIFVQSNPQIQSSWDANAGTLTLSGSASTQEYQSILQSLQFTTNSTNLSTRVISVALKDANGASSNITKSFGLNPPISQNSGSTTNTGSTTNNTTAPTTPTAPTITTTNDVAVTNASTNSIAASANSSASLKGASNVVNLNLLDASSSQAVDENQSSRDKRARANEANARLSSQNLNQLDVLQSKALANSIKDIDYDLRSSLSTNRNSENRVSDSGSRLLQIANRENSASNNGQGTSLLLSLSSPEANEIVQIKVSKADQLAVDLLSLPVQSGGVVVSAAVLWWITRAGGILTALLTSLPSWQHFDPLPILTSTDGQPEDDWGDENEEDDKELDAILSQ
jgi:parallel beta-helix repeat protein